MTRHDVTTFVQWLTELAEYYPHTHLNLEVTVSGYFDALRDLDAACLSALLQEVLRQCRFFPTVAELVQLAATLPAPPACPRCPTGHGTHRGHRVRHFRTGPYCETCDRAMPVPVGYVAYAPPPSDRLRLAEKTPELALDEVRVLVQELYATLNKGSETWHTPRNGTHPNEPYTPRLTGDALAARRAFLREQAERLRREEDAP